MPTVPASEVVTGLQVLTSKSQVLQAPAQKINITSGSLMMIGLGEFPVIVNGFSDITTTATSYLMSWPGVATVSDATDADGILSAYATYTKVTQALLTILIGKSGIMPDVALVGPPVAAVLRQFESVIDSLTYTLADKVPSKVAEIKQNKASFDQTLGQAITSYTGTMGF